MRLSPQLSRVAALTILLMLCWGVGTLVIAPLLDQIVHDREVIARARMTIARYRELEARLPALQRQIALLRTSPTAKSYLADAPPGVQAAEMQATAQKLVSSAGATLRSSRTVPSTTENGFSRLEVELDLTASASALAGLLHAIETAEPAIVVDRVAVQVPESGAGAKAADGQPLLAVTLYLVSYARPGGEGRGA
jgi:hypothetical protein